MIKKILQAKPWMIFFMTIGLPLVIEILFMPSLPNLRFKLIIAIMISIMECCFFAWLYAIANGLQRKLPQDIKLKTKTFNIILILVITLLLLSSFATIVSSELLTNYLELFPLIILIAMCCIMYCLYFTAKIFKTCELHKKTKFSDFAGEFFLFWFFPIGIWIIQPKLNKMIFE